jgi:hypothetical protein
VLGRAPRGGDQDPHQPPHQRGQVLSATNPVHPVVAIGGHVAFVTIEDNGPAVPEEDGSGILEPFSRAREPPASRGRASAWPAIGQLTEKGAVG